MITFENIKQILNDIVQGKTLTTKELNSYGLTSNDLKTLVSYSYLNRVFKGQYTINNIDILYNEALNFEKINCHVATKLYKKCYEINPQYKNCAFLIFKNLIKNNQIEESIPFLRQILNNPDKKDDNSFYLYMLNLITDLPDDLKQIAEKHKEIDICGLDIEKIKNYIYEKKYSSAIRLLNKNSEHNQEFIEVTKYLLLREQKAAAKRKNEINKLIENKEYDEVIDKLSKTLNIEEDTILFLIKNYIFIKDTNTLPKKTIINTLSIKDAIEGKNFELALKLQEKDFDGKNVIHMILKEIVDLVKERNITEKQEKDSNKIYQELLHTLNSNNINYELLCEYLISSKNEKYENLIRCLVKVDIHENSNLKLTKEIIEKININKFALKRTYFINKFNKAMNNNDFESADIYLSVIECLEDIKEEHNLYKYLRKTLNQKSSNPQNNIRKTLYQNDEDYISLEKVIDKLKTKKGIILLPPMNEKKRLRVHELVKAFPNISSQTIGENDEKQIFLSYVRYPFGKNLRLQRTAYDYFSIGAYGKAVYLYKKLIELGINYHDVYGNIAKIYSSSGIKKYALQYFTVAYNRAKEFNKKEMEDYLKQIEKLNNTCDQEELKPYVELKEKEFVAVAKVPNIINLNDILYLVYEEKMSIEDACQQFGYDENQLNMARLIIVKEEYIRANYALGDKILKKVEKSKNKNKEVKEFYKEIYKNRLFYKNRPNEKIYKKQS